MYWSEYRMTWQRKVVYDYQLTINNYLTLENAGIYHQA